MRLSLRLVLAVFSLFASSTEGQAANALLALLSDMLLMHNVATAETLDDMQEFCELLTTLRFFAPMYRILCVAYRLHRAS